MSRLAVLAVVLVVVASGCGSAARDATRPGAHAASQASLVKAEPARLAKRADHLRAAAHKLILRRNAALHGRRRAGAALDALAVAAIRDIALSSAALNGDADPRNGQVFSSTRMVAERAVSGAGVNTDQPVYVVVLDGHFTAYLASPPAGAPLPTGTTMTLTLDADSLQDTDWGVAPHRPDTTALGPATSLGF